jgi:hypothetical protein
MWRRLTLGLLLPLAACQPSAPEAENVVQDNVSNEAVTNAAPSNLTNAAESTAETPTDKTSAAAAANIVEQYAALLEQRRFAEAHRLSGDNQQSDTAFAATFDQFATIEASVGKPGDTEGAAGSIYVNVPLTLSGTLKGGGRYSVSGPVTLRRVNNVPGSTAEQRRWHISATDLKSTG